LNKSLGIKLRNLATQLIYPLLIGTAMLILLSVIGVITHFFGYRPDWSLIAWLWLGDGFLALISWAADDIGIKVYKGRRIF
jgi:hypothetical protein